MSGIVHVNKRTLKAQLKLKKKQSIPLKEEIKEDQSDLIIDESGNAFLKFMLQNMIFLLIMRTRKI